MPRATSCPGADTGRGAGERPGRPAGRRPRVVTGQSGWTGWKSGSRTCGNASPARQTSCPCGSRACGGAPTSETAKKVAAMRPTHAETRPARYLGAADIARGPARAVRVRLDAHRPVVVESVLAYAEAGLSDPPHARGSVHASCPVELRAWSRGGRREGSPCECGRRRIARIVSQGFHRLFGGECSGSSGYIVVAAGREDSRGLGSPMTEFLPRRPRVLGSPRLVALAKEGVPPEWEPGCGAPRRRRPVGRERQPGATGHVTSGPGHRTRRGGAPRATGRAPAAGSPKARVVSPVEGVPRAPGREPWPASRDGRAAPARAQARRPARPRRRPLRCGPRMRGGASRPLPGNH